MIETTGPANQLPGSERTRNPEYNPYAPPKANVALQAPGTSGDDEATRRALIQHETSIKGIGALYYLGFGAAALGAVSVLWIGLSLGERRIIPLPFLLGFGAAYALLAWLLFYLARGMRRLERRVRVLATILAAIGLIGFPIGTLINGYILYLLHSDKGKRVMTPEYQAIVARTPHIKYRTPVWVVVLLALIIVLAVVAIVAAIRS